MKENKALIFLQGASNQMGRKMEGWIKDNNKEMIRLHRWTNKIMLFNFDYEYIGEKPHLILYVFYHRNQTTMCMFCGEKHNHGEAKTNREGHRNAHCSYGSLILPFIIAKDGTVLYQKDGYILRVLKGEYVWV